MPLALGKLPARSDRRTLRLPSLWRRDDLPLPDAVDHHSLLGPYGLYANDRVGNCTAVAAAHVVQTTTGLVGPRVIPRQASVMALYGRVSGYDPRTGAGDAGAYLLDALKEERRAGLGGRTIHAFAAADPRDRDECRRAILLFGGLRVGLNLPAAAQAQFEARSDWDVADDADAALAGTWGGHCMALLGYTPVGPVGYTWGRRQKLTWRFFERYCDEAYASLPSAWRSKDPYDALDWAALGRALAAIGDMPA